VVYVGTIESWRGRVACVCVGVERNRISSKKRWGVFWINVYFCVCVCLKGK
jgi:hypothetical protein